MLRQNGLAMALPARERWTLETVQQSVALGLTQSATRTIAWFKAGNWFPGFLVSVAAVALEWLEATCST